MDNDITVRRMGFEFPADLDPVLIEGQPEESYGAIGLSLLLPYLEPYLIRTMKAARPRITDAKLRDDLERFSAQEGQHYREHRRFNEAIRAKGFAGLADLERELEADYQRFTAEKSLRFNLAFAEGFEAMTTAAALFSFEQGSNEKMHPAARDLFQWHLVEEFEHRTVAFDIYDHVCGGYLYRLGVGLYAQWHTLRFVGRVTQHMLEANPDAVERCGGEAGRKQRLRMQRRAAREKLIPLILRTYLPWYTPHDIEFTDEMRAIAAQYSEQAVSTS